MKEKKDNRGGAREGAGRKASGLPPKKPLPAKVSQVTRDKVKNLAEESGHSQAKILEWAVKNIKNIPKKLD